MIYFNEKKGRDGAIYITNEYLGILRDLRAVVPHDCPYMFPNLRDSCGGTYITYGSIKKPLETACKRLGIPKITMHIFRHLVYTHLVEQGMEWAAFDLTGHRTDMKTHYAHGRPEMRKKRSETLDNVLKVA